MKRKNYFAYIAVVLVLTASAAMPQARTKQTKKTRSSSSTTSQSSPVVTAATTPVNGSGTVGQLAKWTGSGFLGNSIITETKTGEIGIGTTTPGSKLSVQGMIETTLGGLKFPDGTVQTTAGLASIFHDTTLQGNGTASSPLGVVPLQTDGTLKGDGTGGSPLGIKIPLTLSGLLTVDGAIRATTTSGNAVEAKGGDGGSEFGGEGVVGLGGRSNSTGGIGVEGVGGDSIGPFQPGTIGVGGTGVSAVGGDSKGGTGRQGGNGVDALGGSSTDGDGGDGVVTVGGFADRSGNRGGIGIIAVSGLGSLGAAQGLAGLFFGDVEISGNLSKGAGSFKIDHPLDPENKYLYHSFVESPDMKNIYDGTITTDANGDATVTLPDWFEALNEDFRYQLTVIGTFAQAIVAEEMKGNRFTVKTNAPNVKVSWQVTGIRHDAYANKHRIPVEEQKPEEERGLFLHPDAFNQPEDKGVQFLKVAPQIEKLNAARERAKQQPPQK